MNRAGLLVVLSVLPSFGCPITACSAIIGAYLGSEDIDPVPSYVVLDHARDAVKHPAASTLKVHGQAQFERAVHHAESAANETHGWTHLVPVVDEDWSEGEEVAVWITAPYQTQRVAAWEQALGTALAGDGIEAAVVARVDRAREHGKRTRWEQAIAAVPAGEGPIAADFAVVLLWPAVDVTSP